MDGSARSGSGSGPAARRIPINRAQQDLDRPARERYATRELSFASGNATCRGTLYRPAGADAPPVVVLGPGVAAERTFGYPAVAERLAAAGYAVLLFDYRGFGDSDGDDGLVDPERQVADYAAAADRAKRADGLGDGLIAAGWSLAGGHALRLAADRPDVDAAVALAPLVDGRAALSGRALRPLAGGVAAGLRDAACARIGLGRTVPVVGREAERAVVTGPGANRGYLDLVDRESDWQNRTPARSLVKLARYRPIERVASIRAPTLLLAGRDDRQAPAEAVGRAAGRLPAGTFVRAPGDHWAPLSAAFESSVGHALAFLADAV